MKTVLVVTVILVLSTAIANARDVQVRGYSKQDGTFVAPYERSTPNAYKWDNKDYRASQPAYNDSYSEPKHNYGSEWYTPSSTRYEDSNPNNDTQPLQSPTLNNNSYDYLNR